MLAGIGHNGCLLRYRCHPVHNGLTGDQNESGDPGRPVAPATHYRRIIPMRRGALYAESDTVRGIGDRHDAKIVVCLRSSNCHGHRNPRWSSTACRISAPFNGRPSCGYTDLAAGQAGPSAASETEHARTPRSRPGDRRRPGHRRFHSHRNSHPMRAHGRGRAGIRRARDCLSQIGR